MTCLWSRGHGIDEIALADLISGDGIAAAFVERVASRPGEGVASSFKFGQAFGSIKATVRLARLPLHLPTPAQWKRKHGLSKDKEASRRLALDLFPSLAERLRRKKDADRAEALLIAAYGREVLL